MSFNKAALRPVIIGLAALSLFSSSCKKAGEPIIVKEQDTTTVIGPTPNTYNFDKLSSWKNFRASQTARYDLSVIGDSYVQGNYFAYLLRAKLLSEGYLDGGPGYCSFSRFDPNELYSIDSSIDPTELTFTYDPLQWSVEQENTIGPCGDVKSNVDHSTINVTATVELHNLTLLYEKHPGAGDFRYRLNGGNWNTVSASADAQSIAELSINTTDAGTNINVEIESLSAGQIFCGIVGRRTGHVLNVHKVGMSGGLSVFFAQNDLWTSSMKALNSKGVVIMFGTNEMEFDIDPENLRTNVQYIITRLREIQPNCDIIIACPPQTKFEKEEPKKYKIEDYGAVLYKLAVTNKTAFVNFPAIFPPFSQASVDQGYMDTDRRHPGEKGGELIAQTIYEAFKK